MCCCTSCSLEYRLANTSSWACTHVSAGLVALLITPICSRRIVHRQVPSRSADIVNELGEVSVWTTEFLRLNLYSCKLNGYSCKLSCNSCRLTCLVIVQAKRARPRTPTPGSYRGTKPLMDRDGPPRGRQVLHSWDAFTFCNC